MPFVLAHIKALRSQGHPVLQGIEQDCCRLIFVFRITCLVTVCLSMPGTHKAEIRVGVQAHIRWSSGGHCPTFVSVIKCSLSQESIDLVQT